MLSSILQIIFSIAPLLFGRRLFWVFVAVAGFLVGLALAGLLISDQSQVIHVLVGIIVGLIGGLLAVYLTKPMAAVGGFLAWGGAALLLSFPLRAKGRLAVGFHFFVAGLIGALLVFFLFDWALIISSSISGATGFAAGLALSLVVCHSPCIWSLWWCCWPWASSIKPRNAGRESHHWHPGTDRLSHP